MTSSLYFTGSPDEARVITCKCEKQKNSSTVSKVFGSNWHKKYFTLDLLSIWMQMRFSSDKSFASYKIILLDEVLMAVSIPESLELHINTPYRPYKFRFKEKEDFKKVCYLLSCVVHRSTGQPLLPPQDKIEQQIHVGKESQLPQPPKFELNKGIGSPTTRQAIYSKIITNSNFNGTTNPGEEKPVAAPYTRGSIIRGNKPLLTVQKENPILEEAKPTKELKKEYSNFKEESKELKESMTERPERKPITLKKLDAFKNSETGEATANLKSMLQTHATSRPMKRQFSISILNHTDAPSNHHNDPTVPLISIPKKEITIPIKRITDKGISARGNSFSFKDRKDSAPMMTKKLDHLSAQLKSLTKRTDGKDSDSDD